LIFKIVLPSSLVPLIRRGRAVPFVLIQKEPKNQDSRKASSRTRPFTLHQTEARAVKLLLHFGRAALYLLSHFAEAVLLSPPHNPDLNRLNGPALFKAGVY